MVGKRGRPPTYSREDLIAAALRLGPDGLTLQALADELGVTRTSLYKRVRDQSEVGEIVLAHLMEQPAGGDWAPAEDASWDEWLRAYARTLRRTMLTVGGWIRYATPPQMYTSESLQSTNRMFAALLVAGFSPLDASLAVQFCFDVLFASVRAEADTPVVALSAALAAELESEDGLTALRQMVGVRDGVSAEARFEHNLDCALRGIAARASVDLGARLGDPRRGRTVQEA